MWEERWGVHAFTVATVYRGLKAAHVDISAQPRFREKHLLQVRRRARELRGLLGEPLAAAREVMPQAKEGGRAQL